MVQLNSFRQRAQPSDLVGSKNCASEFSTYSHIFNHFDGVLLREIGLPYRDLIHIDCSPSAG